MTLRARLLLGLSVFVAALILLGGFSAWQLWRMSALSERIIAENYDSVVAAQNMKESLERQDSAALFVLLNRTERGLKQMQEHRARFDADYGRAAGNITEPGEREIVQAIGAARDEYYRRFDRFLAEARGADSGESRFTDRVINEYFQQLEPLFTDLRHECDRLLTVNQDAMRRKAGQATELGQWWFSATFAVALGLVGAAMWFAFVHVREIDRMRSQFLAGASHELRTPLTSVVMGVNLLLEGAAGPLAAKQTDILMMCQADARRLDQLVKELLDLSRIESGEAAPQLAPILARDLVVEATDSLRRQAEAKGLTLLVNAPARQPVIAADRGQIERVIANLVSNAIRATERGGTIEVSAASGDDFVAISVRDTGRGIPHDYLDRIFEPFVQAPNAPAGGAGLGLSISRRIARAHGGQLVVRSQVGQGTTFTLTLPLAAQTAA